MTRPPPLKLRRVKIQQINMQQNIKKIIEREEVWNRLAFVWRKCATPPARPCKELLKIWEGVVKEVCGKAKNSKALILGSTPELRDLVLKYNFQSIACDMNSSMLEAMEQLMKHKNHLKNQKVRCNWLEMNFKENSIDLVLGHQSLEQILTIGDLKKLLSKLKFFLKPNGRILICEVIREKKKPEITGKDWVKLFDKYKNKTISDCELHHFLKYNSNWNSYNKSPSLMGTSSIYKKIKELDKQNKSVKNFALWWEKVIGNSNKRILIFLRKDLEKLLKQYFQLLPIKQCDDFHFCKYMPSYLGKPKK